jgi:hypothetical protein
MDCFFEDIIAYYAEICLIKFDVNKKNVVFLQPK